MERQFYFHPQCKCIEMQLTEVVCLSNLSSGQGLEDWYEDSEGEWTDC